MVTKMNGLFRIAFRTLCWGAFVAVCVTATVTVYGIQPEVLTTFKSPKRSATNPVLARSDATPAEVSQIEGGFARAETASRLDVPPNSGIATGTESNAKPSWRQMPSSSPESGQATPPLLSRRRNPEPAEHAPDESESVEEIVPGHSRKSGAARSDEMNLPPHPDASNQGEVSLGPDLIRPTARQDGISRESEAIENQFTAQPEEESVRRQASPSEPSNDRDLKSDPTPTLPPAEESSDVSVVTPPVAKAVETPEASTTLADPGSSVPPETLPPTDESLPEPVESTSPSNPPGRVDAPSVSEAGVGPTENSFLDRLTQMQRQLDQLALAQQQDRQTVKSLFETTQMFQQQKLEERLEQLEKDLRELQLTRSAPQLPAPSDKSALPEKPPVSGSETRTSVSDRVSSSHSAAAETATSNAAAATAAATTEVSGGPVVREERRGQDGQRRFTLNIQRGDDLRELLDALAQKANFNLVLEINVQGDLGLNLQNVTADEALEAIRKSTGCVVEKSGRKVYIRQPAAQSPEQQVFLPPIIK